MKNIKVSMQWQGKTIRVPDDIEMRFNIEPRITSIGTIPHSPLGEKFAYKGSEDDRLNLILEFLSEKEYRDQRERELAEQQPHPTEPF